MTSNDDDICAEVDNLVRCGECFQSFNSSADLSLHSDLHRGGGAEVSLSSWLTEERCRRIASSRFPEINLEAVSLEHHDYIARQKAVRQSGGGEDPVPKMTTLQALESLLGSSKKTPSLLQ